MKKVIILGPAYPLRGGIANFNESLCAEMIKDGIETSIVSFSLQYPSIVFPGTSQFEQSPPNETVNGLTIRPLVNSVNPLNWYGTGKIISNEKPDLLIVRYWLPFFAPALGTIIRRVKKRSPATKVIAITDNILPHEKRPGDRMLTKYFLNSCDGYVVMSTTVRDELLSFLPSPKFRLIHHPVYDIFGPLIEKHAARQKLGLDTNGRYILFFGFIRKYKGLDLLLQAMAEQEIADLNIQLIIAGEYYEDKSKYINLINSLGISSRVRLFDHYIPSQEVALYFASADLITQPYRTASQSGITQLAYHFERPVLVTRVGGLAEVIESDNSGYVTSTDPHDIASKIAEFYKLDRGAAMTSSIAVHKQKFSWRSMVDGIKSLYKEVTT